MKLLERFSKSVKRFLDKKRGNQKNLEPHFDEVGMGKALESKFVQTGLILFAGAIIGAFAMANFKGTNNKTSEN